MNEITEKVSDKLKENPSSNGRLNNNSQKLFTRAKQVIVGGVNSPVRSFKSVGGSPYFVKKAKGAFVFDEDGKKYIDFVQSYGPNILGHSSKPVRQAVSRATKNGFSYGAPTEAEILLAEEIVNSIEGLDMLRLVSSGTEATMSAIRLARGFAQAKNQFERKEIIKFAGCYHGHSDTLLVEGGSGIANQGISGSAGVTDGAVADTIVVPYNQVPPLGDVLSEKTAAVIVEPVAANMGVVAPKLGFLEGLREACDKAGALLIFDEVITGFRIAKGGAVEVYGVKPDLWCFGKVIGGGLPIGAFGGRSDVMECLAPVGDVYQAGTLSGNPIATVAGLATLKCLTSDASRNDAFSELNEKADFLESGFSQAAKAVGLPLSIGRAKSLLSIFFGDALPSNFDEVKAVAENGIYPKFFHAMLERGVAFAPGAYEAIFLSLAHRQKDLEETVEKAVEVFEELAEPAKKDLLAEG